MAVREIQTPLDETTIRSLQVGDEVFLSGLLVTARDMAHKYMVEQKPVFLRPLLRGAALYHCGPVMRKERGSWKAVSAGPTTGRSVAPGRPSPPVRPPRSARNRTPPT